MTIALGILASDGFVLAADTQETHAGILKVDQTKILASNIGPNGPRVNILAVSCAGQGGHMEAINQNLCDGFFRQRPTEMEHVDGMLRNRIGDFYRQHVLPCETLPDYDRPSVSVIAAAQLAGARGLWISDKSVVYQRHPYGAVGIGAGPASVLLGRLWQDGADLRFAQLLALYVLFYVKQTTEGCGQRTEMLIVGPKGAFTFDQHLVVELEREFTKYMEVEEQATRHVLGLTSKDPTSDLSQLRNHLRSFRKTIIEIIEKGVAKTHELGVRDRGIAAWGSDPDIKPHKSRAKGARRVKQMD